MQDITAIMIHYAEQTALSKALRSLNPIRSRLEAVIVITQRDDTLLADVPWSERVYFVSAQGQDDGEMLQETINTMTTPYVLWLCGRDYLPAGITSNVLQLADKQSVLATYKHSRNTTVQLPLLVRTSRVRKQPLDASSELPFTEALFPAWLSRIQAHEIAFKDGLLKQSKASGTRNMTEKHQFLQKYALAPTHRKTPSLTIVMAAYNMAAYVQTAIKSCLLQNEQADELLIMDDGSTDDTYERMRRYNQEKHLKLFQRANGGKARALNDLLPHVSSDFILELDADDWLDPDAIAVIKQQLADLPADAAVLYGNLRMWKQLHDDVQFKSIAKGRPVSGQRDLLAYRFPLGPRIYRTSSLKQTGGFPVSAVADGRLYEDISVLNRLSKRYRLQYRDATVYNVRKHPTNITKQANIDWQTFLQSLE